MTEPDAEPGAACGPGAVAAVQVRDAVDGDLAAITAIYAGHVVGGIATFEETAPSLGQMRQRRIRHRLAQAPIKLRRVAVALQLQARGVIDLISVATRNRRLNFAHRVQIIGFAGVACRRADAGGRMVGIAALQPFFRLGNRFAFSKPMQRQAGIGLRA